MTATEGRRTARICVTNAKGGTGKTTVAINVAGALNDRGHDVLFVDMDPLGNATEGLGYLDEYFSDPPSMFDALTDPDQRDVVNDVRIEHEEMDVLPASIDLQDAERELTIADLMAELKGSPTADPRNLQPYAMQITPDAVGGNHAKDQLTRALDALDREYDYVVVDSPPYFGELMDASIFATGNIIVPSLTEVASQGGIELLFDRVDALGRKTSTTVRVIGAVANRIEWSEEDQKMLAWMEEAFRGVPVWQVRKRIVLQKAFANGESVFKYSAGSDATRWFKTIAADLDKRFGLEDRT